MKQVRPIKILPVLDLKHGVVVRGVAGRRSEYRPIESRLCRDPSPASVARGLREAFGFDECYVADLDAIAGGEPNWSAYDDVAAAGFRPWIDAGIGDARRAALLDEFFRRRNIDGRIIVGLESTADETALRAIFAAIDAARLVFSLDLQEGRPLTTSTAWRKRSPDEIAACAVALGVRSMIVLDLAGVGVGRGVPTLDLCRRLRAAYPTLEITTGGGVRDVRDLRAIRDAGCDAALVASALHDGRFTRDGLNDEL